MLPGIGYCFGCSWRVLRNKSPCGGRGGGEIGYYAIITSLPPYYISITAPSISFATSNPLQLLIT